MQVGHRSHPLRSAVATMTPGAPSSHRSALRHLHPSVPRAPRSTVPAPPAGDTVGGMRAIEYSLTGDPDVLTLVERPVPDPGPGEVRVRIHRSGVNPTDWKSRRGSGPGAAVDPPQVPNQDGSGVVDAVGQGVEAALVGLRVWIWEAAHLRPAGGTAQEYAVVPARHVVLLPDVASFDLGASLGRPLPDRAPVPDRDRGRSDPARPGHADGRTVLVAGGAGAVGNAAIQLARWSDATVITTVSSPEKAAPRGARGRRPRHRLPAAGRRRRGPRDRAARREHDRRGVPGGERRARRGGARPARLGGGVRQQRRRHDGAAGASLDGAERPLAVRAGLQRPRGLACPRAGGRRRGRAGRGGAGRGEAGLPLHHYPLDQAAEAHAAVEDGAVGKVLIDVRP